MQKPWLVRGAAEGGQNIFPTQSDVHQGAVLRILLVQIPCLRQAFHRFPQHALVKPVRPADVFDSLPVSLTVRIARFQEGLFRLGQKGPRNLARRKCP